MENYKPTLLSNINENPIKLNVSKLYINELSSCWLRLNFIWMRLHIVLPGSPPPAFVRVYFIITYKSEAH